MGKASTSYRWKRKHLGIDSVEDMFGFEAYLSLVKQGVEIIRSLPMASMSPVCHLFDTCLTPIFQGKYMKIP